MVAITAKLVADMIPVAGDDRVVTIDLHAQAIKGFFNLPVDHLYAMPVFIDKIKKYADSDDLVIVSPDAGGVERARAYAKRIPASLAIVDKRRVGNKDKTETMKVIGEGRGGWCSYPSGMWQRVCPCEPMAVS